MITRCHSGHGPTFGTEMWQRSRKEKGGGRGVESDGETEVRFVVLAEAFNVNNVILAFVL